MFGEPGDAKMPSYSSLFCNLPEEVNKEIDRRTSRNINVGGPECLLMRRIDAGAGARAVAARLHQRGRGAALMCRKMTFRDILAFRKEMEITLLQALSALMQLRNAA